MEGGNVDRLDDLIAEEYIQHNPDAADGRDSFATLLIAPDRPLWYDEIVLLVGSGNFVATLSKARFANRAMAQVDVFRLQDGKVVEHWDNVEPVPEHDVNSGKF